MKHLLVRTGALATLFFSLSCADAANASGKGVPSELVISHMPRKVMAEADEETAETEGNILVKAINRVSWFNSKPNRKAEYYIFARFSRTSYMRYVGCRRYVRCTYAYVAQDMPGIAKFHKDMRKDGRAELLLFCGDTDKGMTKGCLKEFKVKCPAAMLEDQDVYNLPGVGALSAGYAAVVRASDGAVIRQGQIKVIVSKWREIVEQ